MKSPKNNKATDKGCCENETVQSNGVVTRPNTYEILNKMCLSSKHRALIPGIIDGNCQCGNCKVRVREHRYHRGAFIGDTSHYDYVFDSEEVQKAFASPKKDITDKYKCQNYYDDDNILRDCTCSKCEAPIPSHDCNQNIESNMAPAHCRVCKKDMSTPSLSEGEGWEKEFDEIVDNTKYTEYMGGGRFCCGGDYCEKGHNEWIKDFISQTRAEERERMVALGDEMKQEAEAHPMRYFDQDQADEYNKGYRRAITAYQQKIKSLDS